MESIDLLPLLHQQGLSIIEKKDGYHRPSFSLNVVTKEFIELFKVVKNTINPTIIAGFCFNILPYITKNGPKFSEQEATALCEKFGDFLRVFPAPSAMAEKPI